jgi:hypothetical protein
MDLPQLQALKKVVGDMRFMQATALVASGLNESKDAKKYMHDLAELDDALDSEMRIGCALAIGEALENERKWQMKGKRDEPAM